MILIAHERRSEILLLFTQRLVHVIIFNLGDDVVLVLNPCCSVDVFRTML